MSPRTKPVAPRIVVEIVLVVVAIAAVSVVVAGLRRSMPDSDFNAGVAPIESPDDPSAEPVTCERTLPEVSPLPADQRNIDPVGRITSSAVYECPDAFDQQVVVYIGEVIGDVLRRDGGAWVLMNDDAYALEVGPLQGHRNFRGGNSGLSVWLPERLVDLIERTGGPNWRGDVLRLRGVIHRSDPADGGGLTFRAIDGTRAAEAVQVEEPLNAPQAIVAIVFAMAAIALTLVERTAARRR